MIKITMYDYMNKECFCLISIADILGSVAGQLYSQAPNYTPRFFGKIMEGLRSEIERIDNTEKEKFKFENKDTYNEFTTFRIKSNNVEFFIGQILSSIPEFIDLNLSQNEYINGIKVDDESRSKFTFVSMYDVMNKDSHLYDFIDLDAFIRNVATKLIFNDMTINFKVFFEVEEF